MEKRQSVDQRSTLSPRVTRSTGLVIGAAVLAAVLGATVADAGPRRARLSSDLTAQLAAGASQVDVIVSGSPERVQRLAARHGGRIKKALSSGAVLTLSAASLNSMA